MRVHVVASDEAADLAPSLVALLGELSDRAAALDPALVAARLRDDRARVVVAASDGQLIGTATLTMFTTLTDGLVGHVEDVVVAVAARGAGVGRLLMEAVHREARRLKLQYVELTTRPSREAANALYQSLGYERRSTNVYRLRLARSDL
jgi:ribosomal protein S18 acetylase RimI-like enzyme